MDILNWLTSWLDWGVSACICLVIIFGYVLVLEKKFNRLHDRVAEFEKRLGASAGDEDDR